LRHQLSVQFEYSPREHVRALDETPYRRLLKKWWVPGSVAFITVLVAWQAIRRNVYDGSLSALLWFGAFGVVPMLGTLLITPTILRRFEIARYRRARTVDTTARETRQFGEDGITHGEGAQHIPWSMITRVIESANFYLFYHALSDIPDYVPKRVLARSDIDALQALLHDQFHWRTRDLQLLPRAT